MWPKYSALKNLHQLKITAVLTSFANVVESKKCIYVLQSVVFEYTVVVDLSMTKLPTATVGWLCFCKANCLSLFESFRSAKFLYSTIKRVYLTDCFELYIELVCSIISVLCLLIDVFIADVYKLCL